MAWVSLDQRDNDPASFWTYVVTALNTAAKQGIARSYVRRLVAALRGTDHDNHPKQALIEPLSERELEVRPSPRRFFGLTDQVSVVSGIGVIPIFFWELSLGVSMAVKGFRPVAHHLDQRPHRQCTPSARRLREQCRAWSGQPRTGGPLRPVG